jgi:hypothetical protein
MTCNFPNWKFVLLVIFVNSRLNRRSGREGRILLPTTAWWQFPDLLSAPAVEPRVLSRNSKNRDSKENIYWPFICSAEFNINTIF